MVVTSWHRWSAALLLSTCLLYISVRADSTSFENTAIVRTVELGGALTHITTRYSIRALKDGVSEYIFALGEVDGELTTWLDANAKGGDDLVVKQSGLDKKSRTWTYTINLPKPLKANATMTLEFNTVQSNAAHAYPVAARQDEPQSLRYSTDLFVISPYATVIQRSKIRVPTPQVHDYTIPSALSLYTDDQHSATKSGATITYGPYNNIPVSTTPDFLTMAQQRVSIHFEIEMPVLRVLSLRRAAELSHWGANLNIQDAIHLKNDGAELKGHFSRVEHQIHTVQQRPAYGTLRSLTLTLPAGISSPYFYDLIGNVSTSHFRSSSPKSRSSKTLSPSERWSLLELRPRYPLLGGWNYSFTLGWDAPLGDSAKYDAKANRYIVAVPFWTPIPSASVDTAEFSVILPEGATDVEVFEPFPMDTIERTTQITYLDTVGRPCIVFKKKLVTDMHVENVYVSYRVPFTAHLKKPIAVTTATLGIFVLALFARRVDPRLQNGAKK